MKKEVYEKKYPDYEFKDYDSFQVGGKKGKPGWLLIVNDEAIEITNEVWMDFVFDISYAALSAIDILKLHRDMQEKNTSEKEIIN